MATLMKTFVPSNAALFNNLFGNFEGLATPSFADTLPAVNVKEIENGFHIELAAPGLKKEDFKINIHENVLIISAEQKQASEQKEEKYTRKEFSYSSFKRSFTLPKTIDGEKILANYTDGILNIELPKKEEAKAKEPKLIEVL